jgi:integrase
MPRKVQNVDLRDRTSRGKLKISGKPHWVSLGRGLHLGYRKGKQDGQWVWRHYLGAGQYHTDTFATADDLASSNGKTVLTWDEAQDKARELRDAFIQQQAGAPAKKEPLTVARAVEDYVADLRARRGDAPADEAGGRLRKHLLPELGERFLAHLTEADIRGFRNSMVKDDYDEEVVRRSRDSANRVLGIAKAAFNLAFNAGKVDDDRAWRRLGRFEDAGVARKVILTDAQQQKLMDALEADLCNVSLLGAWTGARLKELTDARVRDIDLERGTLTVKSNKGRRGRVRYRDIHLPADALSLLRRLASGKKPGDHLLTTAAGTPWTKSLHARPFAAAVEKAGLEPETTFYALRHSYISRALKAGVPVKAVADQCGTSIAMIQAHYAKFIPSDLARYAQMAAPKLRTDAGQKVVALQPVA